MLRNAPHLCAPLAIMTPCYEVWEVPYYWAGLKLYDLIAGRQLLHLSRFYSANQSKFLFPTISQTDHGRSLKGTIVYYDGQFNDSRFNVALAVTAALCGAAVLNHAEVVALHKDNLTGSVKGARVHDHLTGEEFDVHAKVIINAAGPFSDEVRGLAVENMKPLITPSSGVHVVLPDYYSPDGMGLIVPKTKDGRVIFMLPWLGKTLAGTTDSSTTITMLPEPQENEIQFILDAISDYLCVQVRRTDVHSAWSGIRPLVSDPSLTNTANISREHIITEGPEGLVTIAGGKWTTYRSMAEDAVDLAIRIGSLKPTNFCVTKDLALAGTADWDPAFFTLLAQQFIRMKKTRSGKVFPGVMDTSISHHLSCSYGSLAQQVAVIAQDEGLGKRLAHGYPYLEAEVAYCARNEYCETAVDFIARRSRLAFLDTNAAAKAVPRVVEILATEHKWNRARRKLELKSAFAFLETFKASKNTQFEDLKH
ncbi:hypothetical protein KP509_29G047500 [Ceratopteris richardii]|uniref:glycerol-3-phosphate dehydrogenase n=1 Tax=Ceratopteris richardii TaxID=49495 RepID=A0A8T2R8F9_CERRI|nr:hypothetical protein KP509_29G047500 [Ceratopteris richardii]